MRLWFAGDGLWFAGELICTLMGLDFLAEEGVWGVICGTVEMVCGT